MKKIVRPLLLLIIAVLLQVYLPTLSNALGLTSKLHETKIFINIFDSIIWLLIAWLINNIIDFVLWDTILQNRLKITVPKLIKEIQKIIIFFIAILLITSQVFQTPITGFLAASGLISLLIGFAIRNLISDLFNGLALSFDRPFSQGELLQLQGISPSIPISEVLKVLDTTWRTTRFETEYNDVLVVPNSKLATLTIINLSRNTKGNFKLTVSVEAEVPSSRVLNLLESSVLAAEGILTSPAPDVTISGLKGNAANYSVSYWIEPHKIRPSHAKHNISLNILRNFNQAGFQLKDENFSHTSLIEKDLNVPPAPEHFLKNISLFSKLSSEEKQNLVPQLIPHNYSKGATIVELGAAGNSLFLLVEGLLSVWVKPSEQTGMIKVGYIQSGEYFGEMSLLTGASRSAQVKAETNIFLYEVTKEAIQPLLEKRPELINELSEIIAIHEAVNLEKGQAALTLLEQQQLKESLAQKIANTIRDFFGFE